MIPNSASLWPDFDRSGQGPKGCEILGVAERNDLNSQISMILSGFHKGGAAKSGENGLFRKFVHKSV
jgi:hypothetical protein